MNSDMLDVTNDAHLLPKRKPIGKLTDFQLKALTVADIGKRVRDPGGLVGIVRANARNKAQDSNKRISVTFAYRFRFQGVVREFHCGTWPADGMKEIRQRRDEARNLVRKGQNPIDQKKIALRDHQEATKARLAMIEQHQTECLTITDLFNEWVATVNRKDNGTELKRLFQRDVLSSVGTTYVKSLTEKDVRFLLSAVVGRGSNRMAVMLLADLRQMFRWAEKRKPWKQLIEDNPVEQIEAKRITAPGYEGAERTRTLSNGEIKELAEKLPEAGLLKRTEIAMWIMLACCCRIGEIVQARWEHISLEAGIWTIPKENAKNGVAHTVYLSAFVLPYFQ